MRKKYNNTFLNILSIILILYLLYLLYCSVCENFSEGQYIICTIDENGKDVILTDPFDFVKVDKNKYSAMVQDDTYLLDVSNSTLTINGQIQSVKMKEHKIFFDHDTKFIVEYKILHPKKEIMY